MGPRDFKNEYIGQKKAIPGLPPYLFVALKNPAKIQIFYVSLSKCIHGAIYKFVSVYVVECAKHSTIWYS
jgi:hypothetical protein